MKWLWTPRLYHNPLALTEQEPLRDAFAVRKAAQDDPNTQVTRVWISNWKASLVGLMEEGVANWVSEVYMSCLNLPITDNLNGSEG